MSTPPEPGEYIGTIGPDAGLVINVAEVSDPIFADEGIPPENVGDFMVYIDTGERVIPRTNKQWDKLVEENGLVLLEAW